MSRALNILCAEKGIKNFIAQQIENSGLSEIEKEAQIDYLKKIPLCGTGIPIEIETIKSGKKGTKRAPSAYNLFVKQCFGLPEIKSLSGGAPTKMKACGARWREEKKK